MNPAERPTEPDEDGLDEEIETLISEHGSERAAIRALLHDFDAILADADRAVSRGFLRGYFSQGARPFASDDEP